MGKHLDRVNEMRENLTEEAEDTVVLWAAIRYLAEHLDTTEDAKRAADRAQASRKASEDAQIAGISI